MKHLNGHETAIPEESIKQTQHGLAFTVVCCGKHEKSFHLQNAHKFSNDLPALDRLLMTHERETSDEHEAHITVRDFVAKRAAKAKECEGCQ